jgi:uridine kinase
MQETSEISEIVEILRNCKVSVIGIDGRDGSGKSPLARELATELGYTHIELDDEEYLRENRGQFVPHIKYDKVREKIDNAQNTIILDGVCLLSVLKRLGRDPDLLIYVKRTASCGEWRDEEECDVNDDIDGFIAKENEKNRRFGEAEASIEGTNFDPDEWKLSELKEEIIRYHFELKPHRKADIIYKRID